jgi:hypothetical protein
MVLGVRRCSEGVGDVFFRTRRYVLVGLELGDGLFIWLGNVFRSVRLSG